MGDGVITDSEFEKIFHVDMLSMQNVLRVEVGKRITPGASSDIVERVFNKLCGRQPDQEDFHVALHELQPLYPIRQRLLNDAMRRFEEIREGARSGCGICCPLDDQPA